jgi:hypothetical protein
MTTVTRPSKAAQRRLEMNVAVARMALRWAQKHRASDAELARCQANLARAEAAKRAQMGRRSTAPTFTGAGAAERLREYAENEAWIQDYEGRR